MKEFLIQQTKVQLLSKTSISCCCWNIHWFYTVPESQWELFFWWLLRKTCLMMLCLSQKNKSKFKHSSIFLSISFRYIYSWIWFLPSNEYFSKRKIYNLVFKKYGWETHCHNLFLRDITLYLQTLQIPLCMWFLYVISDIDSVSLSDLLDES